MKLETIQLKKIDDKTIAGATDVFTYIDPDFKKYTRLQDTTLSDTAAVFEMERDATFAQIFTEPEKMYLSQEQIIEFCRNHKDKLQKYSYTFFLFKYNGNFFVADVYVYSDGLYVNVRPLSYDFVWLAEYRHRFVLLQLNFSDSDMIPSPSEPLSLPEILTINGVTYKKI